jgi:hypothetical protein
MSELDLKAIETRHVRAGVEGDYRCWWCGTEKSWPCDALKAVAEVRRLEGLVTEQSLRYLARDGEAIRLTERVAELEAALRDTRDKLNHWGWGIDAVLVQRDEQ